ncbi:MAG: hypothetical protein J7L32_05245 [Thermoplasmata archaeon]|nr:hypothetical protein [Thermoplasmata archaeon]
MERQNKPDTYAISTIAGGISAITNAIKHGFPRIVTGTDEYGNPTGDLIFSPLSPDELEYIASVLLVDDSERSAFLSIIDEFRNGKEIMENLIDRNGNAYEVTLNITLDNEGFKTQLIKKLTGTVNKMIVADVNTVINFASVVQAVLKSMSAQDSRKLYKIPEE